jgi:hypothetical protein
MHKSKRDVIGEFYELYVEMLKRGKTHEQALAELDYLPAITMSRLKKRIVENSVQSVDKTGSAS